ncbi:hypothetical protein [Octadecabacter sp. R77987]|uniref:hypothetical protein n=1 Tax=Octadecabacter sp. R77987 TaxID=3093874 RepID=UPI00366B1280
MSHHAGEFEHRDIGGGYVAFEGFWSVPGMGGYAFLSVTDCAKGNELRVVTKRNSPDVSFNVETEVLAVFEAALVSSTEYSLLTLSNLFRHDFPDQVHVSQRHEASCGCLAVYPNRTARADYDVLPRIFEDNDGVIQ